MKKNVKGFEELYSVSFDGKVYSKRLDKPLKVDATSGYERVILQKDKHKERWLVHRLVALHFIDGYFDGAIVNHIDGNPLNNNFCNLEWCNQSHNILEAVHNTKTRDTADRKSTRLNSSHQIISYAVFCLKKKKKTKTKQQS